VDAVESHPRRLHLLTSRVGWSFEELRLEAQTEHQSVDRPVAGALLLIMSCCAVGKHVR